MLLLFGVALLVLAIGVVVLFAMLGELASRVPRPESREGWVQPLEEARLGHAPDVWPAELFDVARAPRSVLLVLSTVCRSCETVATQLITDQADWAEVALLVSSATQDRGHGFIAEYRLGRYAHYVDEGGDWVSDEFDVRTSPTALVFHHGRLASAYAFSDVARLRSEVDDTTRGRDQKEAV